MFRIFLNLIRCSLYIAVGCLVGYYNFGVSGVLGLATNIVFFALGMLMVMSWKSPEKSCCDHSSEETFSPETNTDVFAVERLDTTDRANQL